VGEVVEMLGLCLPAEAAAAAEQEEPDLSKAAAKEPRGTTVAVEELKGMKEAVEEVLVAEHSCSPFVK
jgi:hypothetical protein